MAHPLHVLAVAALAATLVALQAQARSDEDAVAAPGAEASLQAAIPAVPAEVGTNPTTRRLNSPGIEAAIASTLEQSRNVTLLPSESFKGSDLEPVDGVEARTRVVPNLPAYMVLGSRLFVVPDAELYTPSGTESAEFARHPGLYIGDVFGLNSKAAYRFAGEELWRSTMADYRDLAHAIALGGDRGEGRMILSAVAAEDVAIRARDEQGGVISVADRFKAGQMGDTSRFLSGPENPVDIPVVKVDW